MPSTDHPNAEDARPDGEPTQDGEPAFRDAEAWLAERGIRREPLIISTPGDERSPDGGPPPQDPSRDEQRPPTPPPVGTQAPPDEGAEAGPAGEAGETGGAPTHPGHREDREVQDAGSADEPADGAASTSTPNPGRLDDQVSEATAYARRATANTPLSEARLRSKMESRGYPPSVVTQAMQRARDERIVDDHAYAMALVEEGRGKGHAPLRLKTDMQKRDLSDDAIEAALDTIGDRDPQAQAFAVARKRAERYRDVDTETAYRRLVGYLARRGYTEALSRKVAREAVFNDREPQRTAER